MLRLNRIQFFKIYHRLSNKYHNPLAGLDLDLDNQNFKESRKNDNEKDFNEFSHKWKESIKPEIIESVDLDVETKSKMDLKDDLEVENGNKDFSLPQTNSSSTFSDSRNTSELSFLTMNQKTYLFPTIVHGNFGKFEVINNADNSLSYKANLPFQTVFTAERNKLNILAIYEYFQFLKRQNKPLTKHFYVDWAVDQVYDVSDHKPYPRTFHFRVSERDKSRSVSKRKNKKTGRIQTSTNRLLTMIERIRNDNIELSTIICIDENTGKRVRLSIENKEKLMQELETIRIIDQHRDNEHNKNSITRELRRSPAYPSFAFSYEWTSTFVNRQTEELLRNSQNNILENLKSKSDRLLLNKRRSLQEYMSKVVQMGSIPWENDLAYQEFIKEFPEIDSGHKDDTIYLYPLLWKTEQYLARKNRLLRDERIELNYLYKNDKLESDWNINWSNKNPNSNQLFSSIFKHGGLKDKNMIYIQFVGKSIYYLKISENLKMSSRRIDTPDLIKQEAIKKVQQHTDPFDQGKVWPITSNYFPEANLSEVNVKIEAEQELGKMLVRSNFIEDEQSIREVLENLLMETTSELITSDTTKTSTMGQLDNYERQLKNLLPRLPSDHFTNRSINLSKNYSNYNEAENYIKILYAVSSCRDLFDIDNSDYLENMSRKPWKYIIDGEKSSFLKFQDELFFRILANVEESTKFNSKYSYNRFFSSECSVSNFEKNAFNKIIEYELTFSSVREQSNLKELLKNLNNYNLSNLKDNAPETYKKLLNEVKHFFPVICQHDFPDYSGARLFDIVKPAEVDSATINKICKIFDGDSDNKVELSSSEEDQKEDSDEDLAFDLSFLK